MLWRVSVWLRRSGVFLVSHFDFWRLIDSYQVNAAAIRAVYVGVASHSTPKTWCTRLASALDSSKDEVSNWDRNWRD